MGEIRTVKGRERERATAAERAVQPRRDGNCSENQCPDSLTTSVVRRIGCIRCAACAAYPPTAATLPPHFPGPTNTDSLLQVDLWTLRASGSYGHLRMAPPNRCLHEEGHQAASCEARRQKEHWRDRASARIADPRYDVLRDEATKVAHRIDRSEPCRRRSASQEFRRQAPQHRLRAKDSS